MFIDNHIKYLHLQNTHTHTHKNCQIITGGVTGLKEIVKKVQQGNEIIRR